ncbi:MAG: hypothetical protein ACYDHF_08010 [Candidatus Cryosericum sp.]
MAVRKTEIVQLAEPEPQFFDETPEDEALKQVIGQLGGDTEGGKVNVYRMRPNKPLAFVKSYQPNEFTEEALQAEYGPGDYQVRVYDSRGLRARKVIAIDSPINAPVPGAGPQPYMVDKLVENMNTGFAKMGEMFAQALGQLAANQPKAKTTMETLQELQMMREIMGVNQHQQTDPMAVLNLAKELSGMISPPPNDENTMLMEGIKMFGPLLQNQLAGQGQPAPVPNPAPTMIPNPAPHLISPVATAVAAIPNPQQDNPEMFITLYLKGLVANAKADKDPLPYAHVILDMAGEKFVREMIDSPVWFSEIVKRVPEATQYQAWFEELRGDMVKILEDLTNERKANNSGDNPLPDSNNAAEFDSTKPSGTGTTG